MTRRYILAPEAALDLVEIWRYLKKNARVEIADRVEAAVREIVFLPRTTGPGRAQGSDGQSRKVLCGLSYLIDYLPETKPLQVVTILHGNRDVERILTEQGATRSFA